MRLLIIGPPGAGKGTQAAVVAEKIGIPAISTGDIFRANVRAGTELGLAARQHIDVGEFVPDEITNGMVEQRLHEHDALNGFLLDGYPRTVGQVVVLDAILGRLGTTLDAVLVLEVDRDEVTSRLLRRANVEGRTDDTEPVIRRRLEIYAEQTAPLIAAYSARGLTRSVPGAGDVADVTERLMASLPN